jgi:hypothetical protein
VAAADIVKLEGLSAGGRLASADALKAKAYVEQLLMRREGQNTALAFAKAFPLPEGVESLTCTKGECTVSGPADGLTQQRISMFEEAARSLTPCTDKVCGHSYQIMYGSHLIPLMQATHGAKLFEIGLGCNMGYGPGASVALWKKMFPDLELWEAEYNETCVKNMQDHMNGIHVVTGDQANQTALQSWIAESGGHFDAVVDDGGHSNIQIRNSFESLWPHVKPGGLYFLEDLQVGRVARFQPNGGVVVADMVEAWVEQLLIQKTLIDHPLPEGVQTIFCQAEACALRKAS